VTTAAELFVKVGSEVSGALGGLGLVDAEVKKHEVTWSSLGGTMSKVGGATVLGIGAIGVASIHMAGEFQQSTNVLVTAAGESQKALGGIRKGIQDIATSTGTSWQNLAAGEYMIEKAGYRGADSLKILRASAQGAREENASLATVTSAVTSIMASYHIPASQAVQVTNALKTGAGSAKTTMEEFAGSLGSVLPIAAKAGISFPQVAGAIGEMTSHGLTADRATQMLANTIQSLQNPTHQAIAEMGQMGLNATTVASHLGKVGLTGTINELVTAITQHMGKSGLVIQSAFKQSQIAGQDLNTMLKAMPPNLQNLANQFLAGHLTQTQWAKDLRALPQPAANLERQMASLANRSHGFNDIIRQGGPNAQTFSAALAQMTGGSVGLSTVLQLSGDSAAGFATRVQATNKSLHDSATSVEGWSSTSKLFNVEVDKAKQKLDFLAITIGSHLIPVVTSVVGWFSRHTSAAIALAGIIGGVLTASVIVFSARMVIAVAQGVAGFAKLIAQGVAWVAANAASFAETAALWTMYAAEQAASIATQIAQFATLIASKVAAGAVWLATNAAMVASNAVAAASATAAFIAENAATLGIVAGIAVLVAAIVYAAMHWKQVWGDIKNAALDAYHFLDNNVFHPVAHAFTWLWGQIQGVWHDISGFLKMWGPVALALLVPFIGIPLYLFTHWHQVVGFMHTVWTDVKNTVVTDVNAIIAWLKGFPSNIVHALGDVGNLLVNAGKAIIQGLWNGMKSTWHDATGWISGLGGWIKAHKGPMDKDQVLLWNEGQAIIQGLVGGMMSQMPLLEASLAKVTSTITSGAAAKGVLGDIAAAVAPTKQSNTVSATIDYANARSAALAQAPAVDAANAKVAALTAEYDKLSKALANKEAADKSSLAAAQKHVQALEDQARAARESAAAMPSHTKAERDAKAAAEDHARALGDEAHSAQEALTALRQHDATMTASLQNQLSNAQKALSAAKQAATGSTQALQQAEQAAQDAAKTLVSSVQSDVNAFASTVSSFTNSIQQSLTSALPTIGQLWDQLGQGGNQSVQGLQDNLNQILTSTQNFAGDLQNLAAAGASQDLVQQIAAMGAQAGDALAQQLLAAGPTAIASLSKSMQAISDYATGAANKLAQSFFGPGASALSQFITGLESEFPELQSALNPLITEINQLFGAAGLAGPIAATLAGAGAAAKPPTTALPGGPVVAPARVPTLNATVNVSAPGATAGDAQTIAQKTATATADALSKLYTGIKVGT